MRTEIASFERSDQRLLRFADHASDAAGVIAVDSTVLGAEYLGQGASEVATQVGQIAPRLLANLDWADVEGMTLAETADRIAREILASAFLDRAEARAELA